jgi:16S rRNA (cytosine967-C5)-methyltransferase
MTERPGARRESGGGGRRPDGRAAGTGRGAGKRPYRRPQPDPARRAAFDTLSSVAARDAYANLVLPGMLRERGIVGRDAAFATELAYGTLRARGTLDAVLAACSSRPLAEIDPRVLDMLRLGAYQLLRTRVPAHAAVSATVEVARVALTDGPARFVNAVLRRVAEHDEEAWLAQIAPPRDTDPVGHLAIRYAHPEWIVRAFSDALGGDLAETEAALAADDARPGVHLVARPGLVDRDALVAATEGAAGPYSPYAVHLDGGDPGAIELVASGRAGVQDEGSQLCALALVRAPLEADGPGERWLDLCAGPGGKAALLGALAVERGARVTAVEVTEHRAKLVEQSVVRFPVTVLHADGREVGEHPGLPAGGFDRVLVDAPCTGLGALRRRPEARWRRQPSDMPELTKLQRELITAGLRAVRPGGLVAYVTCSPHLAESKLTVADAVRRHGVEQVDARELFPGVPALGRGPGVQLWPHRHGTDAMFFALLRRPESR